MAKTITAEQVRKVQELYNELQDKQDYWFKRYYENKRDQKARKFWEDYMHRQMAIHKVMDILGYDNVINPDSHDAVENDQLWAFVEKAC